MSTIQLVFSFAQLVEHLCLVTSESSDDYFRTDCGLNLSECERTGWSHRLLVPPRWAYSLYTKYPKHSYVLVGPLEKYSQTSDFPWELIQVSLEPIQKI